MGKVDAAIKEFMANKQNFADAFNLGLFGAPVIDAEKLQQFNPDLVAALFKDGGNFIRGVERMLDDAQLAEMVMRDDKATYLLLGAQYQTQIHYAMPVRNLLETALF